nr:50S ribosomal protein P1 [Euryarchaeota archaeon]
MEYVYAAMLLHSAENEINEKNVGAVLKAAGVSSDDARVKALVASLGDDDIVKAMNAAIGAPVAAAPSGGAAPAADAAAPAEEAAAEEEEEDTRFEGPGSLSG